ncbi:MAG TPA: RNA polymerase sigma factor [Tepidisphaeraceae bacterium]|jgi:RNA polymerase sigma-70 factor (ECF subfamily)
MTDDADLTRWFEAHAAALVLYARQWLGRGGAEDAVQEVFVRLLLQPARPRNVKAWLYRAVRNEAISVWRSSRRREHRERVSAPAEVWFEPHDAEGIDAEAVTNALAKLPPAEREIVVLRVWGGLTLQEVSNLVASSVSTVHLHYRSALAKIRERLGVPCENEKKNP